MTLYLFSGLPVPVITWRRNRVTVNGQMDSSEPGLIRSTLLLPPLKRTDWPMTLSCSASNWERGRPLEQSFDVDMERKSIRLSVWMRLISVQRTAPAATREGMNFLSFIQVGRATERTVPNSALRKGCVGNRINRITRARWTDLTGQTREGGNNANRNLASASAVLSVFYWASALAVYNRPSRWFARPLLCTLFPILAVVFCNVAASVCLVVFPQFFLTAQLRFPEDGRLLFPPCQELCTALCAIRIQFLSSVLIVVFVRVIDLFSNSKNPPSQSNFLFWRQSLSQLNSSTTFGGHCGRREEPGGRAAILVTLSRHRVPTHAQDNVVEKRRAPRPFNSQPGT